MVDPLFLDLLHGHLRYLDPDIALSPDSDLRALGLDSMAAVSMLLDVEEEFGVVLPDSALGPATFGSARSLWAAVVDARDRVRDGNPGYR